MRFVRIFKDLASEGLYVAFDQSQGRLQLMRDICDEIGSHLVHSAEVLDLLLEFIGHCIE